jgi:DNA polymerase I-like protein with 3'-5' exonuclease and polymerase domains
MDLSQQAESALRMVREAKLLSFDTETSGLDWKRNFPVGWVIGSTPTDVVYIPTRHGGGGNLPGGGKPPMTATDAYTPHPFEVELGKAFGDRNARQDPGLIIGHHIKFDAHFSANAGVRLGRHLTDTQNNQALIDEYTRSYSLDACAKLYGVTAKLGQPLYEHMAQQFGGPADRKQMSNFWRTNGSDPVVVDYAAGDGVTTLELWLAQKKEIDAQELNQIWDVENRLIWTLFRMERRGMKVDEPYLERAIAGIAKKVEEAYAALPEGFNPRSPAQVRMYVEKYATDWPKTEKGNPSFTEKWLKTFPEGAPIVNLRKWTNLLNSFITPLRDVHAFKGRVHPNIHQLRGDNGGTPARLSCSGPNMQAVPKHDKEPAMLLRRTFVADDGMELYEADWSQAEPRLFAHYAKDTTLLNGYQADPPVDCHTLVANMLNKDRSTVAKRMNMGMFTGMYPKSFSGHMGVDIAEATELWEGWHRVFTEIRGFQDKAKQVLLSRGYVKTIMGRRGRLESRKFGYVAPSKIIQGSQADMMKHKMVLIDEQLEAEGDHLHILMQVHDSLIWQAPATEEGRQRSVELKDFMAEVQCEPYNLRVPFVSDFDKGADWCEASFGETLP